MSDPSTQEAIELTLRVTATDEVTAVKVAEVLARVQVGLSTENVTVFTDVERYEQVCHHHDEVQP